MHRILLIDDDEQLGPPLATVLMLALSWHWIFLINLPIAALVLGLAAGSLPRKAAFALRFGEIEPLISDSLTDESKVIFNRDIRDRVRTVAPFLTLDEDPYAVLVDGRIKYVIDGYTASNSYPYAEALDAAAVTAMGVAMPIATPM